MLVLCVQCVLLAAVVSGVVEHVVMLVLCVQCVLLAAVAAVVSRMVESCHSTPRSSCLRSRLLCHLPRTVPFSFLPAAKVSHLLQLNMLKSFTDIS